MKPKESLFRAVVCRRRPLRGIKEKKSGAAICTAVRRIGELLAEQFPARDDNPNELPDLVMEKKGSR